MPSGKLDADGLDHGERSPAQKTKNGLRAARKRRGMSDWLLERQQTDGGCR